MNGQTVLIGGSSGIGRDTARALAARDCDVAITYCTQSAAESPHMSIRTQAGRGTY